MASHAAGEPHKGSQDPIAGPIDRRLLPPLTSARAQRLVDFVGLQFAPAATAAAIVNVHQDNLWQALFVLVSIVAVGSVLRRRTYPLHLIPFASAVLYAVATPLGAAIGVGLSALDGHPFGHVTAAEVVEVIVGSWLVTGLGALIAARFRRQRRVRLAVIGSRGFARSLKGEMAGVGIHGYEVVGCIDLEPEPTPGSGVPGLGTLESIRGAVTEHELELLVLGPIGPPRGEEAFEARGPSRLEVFEQVANSCLDLPVSMVEATQFYEDLFGHVPLGTTTSAWFQHLLHPRYRAGSSLSKRLLDLGIGSIAAVVALPAVLLAAIAIKLGDGGPVLHRQRRLGEQGQDLELVKLRTMRVGGSGPVWTLSEDERVTPVGRVLRRLHVDELPQLWLVLKGEMSLVGPRPEQASIVQELERRFSYYDRRHLVKPGITGWAQVRCGYGGTHVGSAWKLCHDLYYLKRRSALLDLLITIETLSTIVIPEPIKTPDVRFIVGATSDDELVLEDGRELIRS